MLLFDSALFFCQKVIHHLSPKLSPTLSPTWGITFLLNLGNLYGGLRVGYLLIAVAVLWGFGEYRPDDRLV